MATDLFEQSELTGPSEAIQQAGASVILVSPKSGSIQGMHHDKPGNQFKVNQNIDSASAEDFDGLVLPGGVANPDALRLCPASVGFVRDFFRQHMPVAASCHGLWMLIEAKVVRGRKMTSWPSLKTDLINAGAEWIDDEVVCDQGLVTSRNPNDLPAFCSKAIEEFAEGEHAGQVC